jgi:hypothetical protein
LAEELRTAFAMVCGPVRNEAARRNRSRVLRRSWDATGVLQPPFCHTCRPTVPPPSKTELPIRPELC